MDAVLLRVPVPARWRAARVLAYAWFALTFAAVAAPCLATEPEWSLVAVRDGVEVHTRPVADSPVAEVKATITVEASPARVFAVLLDSDRFVEFVPYVVEVRTVARDSPSVWYLYQRISPPFVSDRDYTLRHESFEEPRSGRYELRWQAAGARGPPPREGVVRVNLCTGAYLVQGIDGDARTRLSYQLHTDPGGALPKWLVNASNSESVPALLQAMARRATDPQYRR